MKKHYLLIAGDHYYPDSGTGYCIGCYETLEDIKNIIKKKEYIEYYTIKGSEHKYDWYDIVDLREWCE